MSLDAKINIKETGYNHSDCKIGIVHLGFGAFHRAHQAVYIDDYMEKSGDLNWGIAAVNLRSAESAEFEKHQVNDHGYLLKTTSPQGVREFREVRSHIHFSDWAKDAQEAEDLLTQSNVKAVSMTVTESGYYYDDHWALNDQDPTIKSEIEGGKKTTVYAYLTAALKLRMETINEPITVLCCDNIRDNGHKLGANFKQYLELVGETELLAWIDTHTTFPSSMVDRITPRATDALREEISQLAPQYVETAIHGESFTQWALMNNFATEFPALDKVGVEIVENVDPYEETKIRVLNGAHTALCYFGALAGHQTFDQAMTDERLRPHFDKLQAENILPGLTLDLPFSKEEYRDAIAERFANQAIADDLARICMDGWSKFPIFVCPTLESCLAQGISPKYCYDSIASWYVYAKRFAQGKMHIPYTEPYWEELKPYLTDGKEEAFARLEPLWFDMPDKYDEFVPGIVSAIRQVEENWPI